ncbi:unnamed protein product [Symbiodinium sp. CCMP2592]|nr:unnamed protein product [Symbiodinium sp. CCMP2592]
MAPRSQKKPAARVIARAVKQRAGGRAARGCEALSIHCVGGTLRAEVGGRQSPELQAAKSQRRLWSRARELLREELSTRTAARRAAFWLGGASRAVACGPCVHCPHEAIAGAICTEGAQSTLARHCWSHRTTCRPGAALDSAMVAPGCLEGEVPMPSLLRRLDLQALPEVLAVLEHENLFEATANILQVDEVVTTAYKWLRAVPPTTFTGPHMDRAYVGEGRRLTAWIPLGPVRCGQRELGSLCWIPGSHTNPEVIERFKDYRRVGSDGERSGWLAADAGALPLPEGCMWRSSHFASGDVAIFGMDLLHSTVPNGTQSFRLSCDTRWQPLEDPPPEGVVVGPWRCQPERPAKEKKMVLLHQKCTCLWGASVPQDDSAPSAFALMASSRDVHPQSYSQDDAGHQECVNKRSQSGIVQPLISRPPLPRLYTQFMNNETSDGQRSVNFEDSPNQRTPSSKRVYDLQDLLKWFEDLMHEFQQDPTEHASLSNVLGPNPWNVGFILNGRLPEQVIQLLKAFLRSVVMKFPKAYSLEEAVMPAAKRGKLRMCKLCLESVGSWSQISLLHVAAFCSHERLEQDLHLILSLKGNINARALFDVELDFPREGLIIKEKVVCSVLPIHFAVYAGNVHAVKVLIRCRAAVECRATFDSVPDYTPLHLATTLWARAGNDAVIQHQVVKILLENTADPTTMDLSGATCNDLRPQGGASASTLRSLRLRSIGIKRGMVVELNLDAIAKKGPKARLEVRQFLETADARRSEFVVMADAEDPHEEDDLLQISLLVRDGLEESRVLKIQQCCVSVLGYRFFQCCLRQVLDYLFGTVQMPSPRSMMDSPIIRSRTLEEESAAAEGSLTVQDFRLGGPSKRRAVTIADFHGEDVMSDPDLEPGILPDVEIEHAVKMKLSNPLRPGKFYRKRNRVAEGYLLHFAIDEMVREEDRKWNVAAEDVLQYIVASRADIHAKADVERRTNANEFCCVTGMHIAAVGHCLPAVKALLSLGASIESAAVFDGIPCWTPLSDALVSTIDYNHATRNPSAPHPSIRGAKESAAVIQHLLEQRANPDGCGGSGGLTCLHLAVGKNCDTELICLLVEHSADVTLKTSEWVRATRAHGNRGWDRGLTPLQICDYADQVYSQKQRSEVMALLAPSLRGASFLLQDVTSMAAFSVSGASELVKRVLDESNKDSGGTAARALSTLRLRAVTGARSAEGLEPVDSIAELLEIAPSIAISVLDELLLTEPARSKQVNIEKVSIEA